MIVQFFILLLNSTRNPNFHGICHFKGGKIIQMPYLIRLGTDDSFPNKMTCKTFVPQTYFRKSDAMS